ncbi:hypothetical protein BC833DRAFT_661415 [Globomyces pollinis-pini]|nr:hypothetical protein BC833DRAFT_661415 [Globomyces pollinis-pini]
MQQRMIESFKMKSFLLLNVVFASLQTFSSLLLPNQLPLAASTTSNSLLVASQADDITATSYQVSKYDLATKLIWKQTIPSFAKTGFNRPVDVQEVGQNCIAFGVEMENSSYQANIHILSATNGTIIKRFGIETPKIFEPSLNRTVSVISGSKLLTSPTTNTIYILITSLMNLDRAAYGYTIVKLDLKELKIEWNVNYQSKLPDGGSLEDAIEKDGQLWVVGGAGIIRIDSKTSAITEVTQSDITNPYRVVDHNTFITISNFSTAAAYTPMMELKWVSDKAGFMQRNAKELWYSKTNALSGNPADWTVKIGMLSQTGKNKWEIEYKSIEGVQEYGFAPKGSSAYILIAGKTKYGCVLGKFFCKWKKDSRLVLVNENGKIVSENVDTSGTLGPHLFAWTEGHYWALDLNGNVVSWTEI